MKERSREIVTQAPASPHANPPLSLASPQIVFSPSFLFFFPPFPHFFLFLKITGALPPLPCHSLTHIRVSENGFLPAPHIRSVDLGALLWLSQRRHFPEETPGGVSQDHVMAAAMA